MSDLFWPPDIIPANVEWSFVDSTATFQSPLTGTVRTVSRGGLRWRCTLNFVNLSGSIRARALAVIASLKGRQNRIWLTDVSQPIGGSFPGTELLTNTSLTAVSPWASTSGEVTVYSDAGRLRLTRTAVTVTPAITHGACTVVSGAQYLLRALWLAGKGAVSYDLRLGTSNGGVEVTNGANLTSAGYQYILGTLAGTTMYPAFADIHTARAADDYQSLAIPSFARCALVNGASQTGSALNIDGLPASTNGLLLAGDMVSIYTTRWEMKRVIAALNSNSSGQGYLQFEPPLSAAPSDNAPIAVTTPTSRFLLADDDPSWSTGPGLFSDVSVSFTEDLT